MRERTAFESLLRRDRWVLGGTFLAAAALCWAWMVPMARDMYGEMTGASAWMMTPTWDFPHQALLFAMWVVMMIGMMLPSATPTLLLYASVLRKSPESDRARALVYASAAGYVLVWIGFSLAATVLQLLLAHWSLISRMMEAKSRVLGAALLLAAGIYQLTSFKRTCLETCRSPVAFIMQHMKPGMWGGFRLGALQGLQCLGCCWVLMLLLFVGGVMNLWWIGGLTLFVVLEKLAPLGAQGGRLSGLLMMSVGLWNLLLGF